MRSFLQLDQYLSKSISNFLKVAEPLRKLLGKDQAFIWGAKEQKAFEEFKSLVTSAKALACFRGECKTSKVSDAEPYRLGAVLLQSQEGEWSALRNLAEVERRYAQTEKEPGHVNGSTCMCMGVTSH